MLWRALARKGRKTRDGGGGDRCGERGRLDMLGVGSLEKQLLVSFGNNDLESSGGAMGGAFLTAMAKLPLSQLQLPLLLNWDTFSVA